MKANEVSGAARGKTLTVSFPITTMLMNPDGGLEFYGTSPDGGEVRLFVRAEAADDLEIDIAAASTEE